ncbi:hypothetical protein H6G64_18175 [Calothrix sp. FACHB-156]|nr:hypothetical protein [Nostoc linckia FACHB-104]MBD2338903.1 hypothetical protein [Calothrix sp. FACHB-156]
MANIKVDDLLNLKLTGTELFNDSESFLTELSDESEQIKVYGGIACVRPTLDQTLPPCLRTSVIITQV